MPGIIVGSLPVEVALKKFKRQVEKAGVVSDLRKREYYEKPSVKRRKKSIQARKRLLKKFVEKNEKQHNGGGY